MQLAITRLQATCGPGRRLPLNPAVFGLIEKLFQERAADVVFNDSLALARQGRLGIVTQLAQVNDIGVVLLIEMLKQSDGTPLDISGASELKIIYSWPDGTRFTKDAILYTNGIDGRLYYVTASGDLPLPGFYSIQAKVTVGDSVIFGEVSQFNVLDNVLAPTAPPAPDPNVGTFVNGDLVAGVLTLTHNLGLVAPYTIDVVIFDSAGHPVLPDQITGAENSVTIDLSTVAPITGTWGYVYTA